jgi:hypothetical protein
MSKKERRESAQSLHEAQRNVGFVGTERSGVWQNLTLQLRDTATHGKVLCICCRVAFVPLIKAPKYLIEACPGAREAYNEMMNETF